MIEKPSRKHLLQTKGQIDSLHLVLQRKICATADGNS